MFALFFERRHHVLLVRFSERLAGESGLAAVVIAGMTVRRESIPRQHQLRRFKGELSVLFISLLFILLSAHLRLSTIAAVGWGGVAVVVLLMWVIRPLGVLASIGGRPLVVVVHGSVDADPAG